MISLLRTIKSINKKTYYVLSFLLIWSFTDYFMADHIWMYKDVIIDDEIVLVPDWELKSELVTRIKLLISFVIHSFIWVLIGISFLVSTER